MPAKLRCVSNNSKSWTDVAATRTASYVTDRSTRGDQNLDPPSGVPAMSGTARTLPDQNLDRASNDGSPALRARSSGVDPGSSTAGRQLRIRMDCEKEGGDPGLRPSGPQRAPVPDNEGRAANLPRLS